MRTLAVILAITACGPAAAEPVRLTNIYTFGSSLDDTGGRFSVFAASADPAFGGGFRIPVSPPYSQGRFSNGPVWVERLAPLVGLTPADGENFAFGGATTRTFDPADPLQTLANFSGQIDLFEGAGGRFGPNDLAVVNFGGNDLPLIAAGADGLPVSDGLGATVAAVIDGMDRLAGLGARNFAVPNLPDIGLTPFIAGDPRAAELSALSREFNRRLAEALDDYQAQEGAFVAEVDFERLFDDIAADPAAFGITNPDRPILSTRPFDLNPAFNPEVDPSEYAGTLFFDQAFHPTTGVHGLMAEGAFAALRAAPDVPEPATLWLLGSAGLAVVTARRRRRGG